MKNNGLTTDDASKLILKHGLNELPQKQKTSALELLLSQFSNTLTIILLTATVLSFLVGDRVDGLLILFILVLNIGLGFWQEYKASKEIEALKKLEVLTTRVIRDGLEQEIMSTHLVPGDLIILEAGDKIPADATLIESHDLTVNEAPLTGESLSVIKTTDPQDRIIYFGTSVVSGRGKAIVTETGKISRFGKLAITLSDVKEEPTVFEKSVNNIAEKVAILAVLAALTIFIIRTSQGGQIIEVLFTSISLLVAAVPEGLPAVMIIVLALGMRRMYRKKTLVRKMSAIQDLGTVTVICSDKTGTITENKMIVKKVILDSQKEELLARAAILASSASLVIKEDGGGFDILGDTTEGAMLVWAKEKGINIDVLRSEGKLIDEVPFNLKNRIMTTVWEHNGKTTIYTKGAPEVILPLCKLSEEDARQYTNKYQAMASEGFRMIALAIKELKSSEWSQTDVQKFANQMNFLGFLGIADPVRRQVNHAIEISRKAGIKTVMVTGDNELTAKSVAEEIGLLQEGDEIMSGAQLDQLSDSQLISKLEKIRIFARIIPEHKLRIVQLLQQKGEIVAVTGDGVNDSLALKQSNIGIAMGITGTDVAKEASDMIILDDNYATIISAIEQGRLIYSNILKILKFLLTGNLAEILVIIVAVLAGLPTPLFPVQILWVNFVTDGLPALALAVDLPSGRIMTRPPKKDPENLIDVATFRFILVYSLVISSLTLAIYAFTVLNTYDIYKSRAYAFSALVVFQMIFIFAMRRQHSVFSNKYLFFSVMFILLLQLLIMTVPPLQVLFKITE